MIGCRSLDRELEVATALARQAGAALRRYRSSSFDVYYKRHGEPVTLADLEADMIIRVGLRTAFPGSALFSEEAGDSPARLGHAGVWIVDPLDGTSDFIEHGDDHAVSIGLAIGGRAALGVVYNPVRDELFAGHQDVGVTLNGSPVRVSDASDLDNARLAVSRKEWRRGLDGLDGTLGIVPRASMAYKLARVAAGLDDGTFTTKPRKEWGTCAGVALVLAAGGSATLLDGRAIRFNRTEPRQPLGMVAAGPVLHRLLLAALPRLIMREAGTSRRRVNE